MIEQRHSADSRDVSAHVGETFGRYRLLGLLGQGGMGRLYVAERRGIQGFVKIVALKRILPHLADSAQLKEMFLNEARIAARLEHPNIVATYELGEVDGKYFISMEYLPGEDLSAIITRCQVGGRPIPAEVAAALAQQAAQGLHYAHEARDAQGKPIGLVHRDVNPRNIFVTYHGVVKLLDFGVVRGPQSQKSVARRVQGQIWLLRAGAAGRRARRSADRRLLSGHRAVGVPDRRAPVRRQLGRDHHRRRPFAEGGASQQHAPRRSPRRSTRS